MTVVASLRQASLNVALNSQNRFFACSGCLKSPTGCSCWVSSPLHLRLCRILSPIDSCDSSANSSLSFSCVPDPADGHTYLPAGHHATTGRREKAVFIYYDMWDIKYLSKFKWDDLTEEITYENTIREQKLALELFVAKREWHFYLSKVDQSRALSSIEERLKKKQELQEGVA